MDFNTLWYGVTEFFRIYFLIGFSLTSVILIAMKNSDDSADYEFINYAGVMAVYILFWPYMIYQTHKV